MIIGLVTWGVFKILGRNKVTPGGESFPLNMTTQGSMNLFGKKNPSSYDEDHTKVPSVGSEKR
jgi:hypothetical protein